MLKGTRLSVVVFDLVMDDIICQKHVLASIKYMCNSTKFENCVYVFCFEKGCALCCIARDKAIVLQSETNMQLIDME